MLSTWLYASVCTSNRIEARKFVHDIVDVSRVRNGALGVTGALVWTGTWFAQFLEGPQAGMAALRHSISGDPRHVGLLTLEAADAPTRAFEGWSLAYSGTASFFEQELSRICELTQTDSDRAAKDLKLLLAEFSRVS